MPDRLHDPEMTEPPFDPLPDEDFRSEDLRTPAEGGPEISSDFVDVTLARVLADRARIRAEAARVDEVRLPRELLDAYIVPEPGPGFVDDTLRRLRAQRARDEERFEELLESFTVPSAQPDFVQRTLRALRVERSGLRLVRGEAATRPAPATRRRPLWLAAAAAAVIAALGLAFWPRTGGEGLTTEIAVESAQRYTPARWATSLERLSERADGGIRFEPVDALQLLAAQAAAEESR